MTSLEVETILLKENEEWINIPLNDFGRYMKQLAVELIQLRNIMRSENETAIKDA